MRGDLYRLKAPKDVHGHEQAGGRYAVVLQSDDLPLHLDRGANLVRPAGSIFSP